MLRLSNYWALVFLLLIPYTFYLSRKSLADLSSWRRWSTFGLRTLLILLLILSLAGFKLVWKVDKLCVIFVLDTSNSVSKGESQRALELIQKVLGNLGENDEAALIVFGREAYVEVPPKTKPEIKKISAVPLADYTNLASAIRVAMELFPEPSQKRIVLMTDGNENFGDVLDEAILARSSDVQIQTIPLSTRGEGMDEVLMDGLIGPGSVDQGRVFELKAVVNSTINGTASLKLFRDRNYLGEQEVELTADKRQVFTFPQVLKEEGTYVYEVLMESSIDTMMENNRANTLVISGGRPEILYISSDERQADYLYKALVEKNMEVTLLTDPSGMPTSLSEMQNYSAVVFDDVPADSFSMPQMKIIESYVQDLGGGFVMIGGENSFGSGGYYKTPIEEILPVKMIPERKKGALSIVLAIDRSGSMAATSGRYVKIDLAKEAAVSVVDFLTDKDQIGVIAFDAEAQEIVRLEKVRSKGEIEDKIATIRPAGGTNMYPALEIAHRRLRDADTKLKHIILVSDGKSKQPDDAYALAREMAQDKITVSTVAIGADADRKLMQNIADLGLGRYYETDDAGSLPRIFVKEAFAASELIMEGEFRSIISSESEILKGLVGEERREEGSLGSADVSASSSPDTSLLPTLRGYVGTSAKEDASVPITSDQDDPILSTWQYGLGRTLAFTSDVKPRWAVEWLKWEDFGKFWSQAIGWTLAAPSGEFDASASIVGSAGLVTVDAVDSSGHFRNFLDFQVNVVTPDLSRESISLKQSAPGRYEAEFKAGQMGTYLLSVREMKDGKVVSSQNTGAIVSYSPEYKDLETNYPLLESLAASTGGKFRPEIGEIAVHSGESVWQLRELWRFLALMSIPLFFLDVALRRVTISKEQISELRNRLHFPKSDTQATTTRTMINLRHRKEAVLDVHKYQMEQDVSPSDAKARSDRAETTPKPVSTDTEEAYTSRLLKAKKRAEENRDE